MLTQERRRILYLRSTLVMKLGDIDRAVELAQQSLQIRSAKIKDHPATASSCNRLAMLLEEGGKINDAMWDSNYPPSKIWHLNANAL